MRVGKKQHVVEAKKTRSCVVRLEKCRSPGSNSPKSSPQMADEKKFKGPLKKRPITQLSTPNPPTIPKFKEKIKSRLLHQKESLSPSPSPSSYLEDSPLTVAAGRSRRAIKPNPKYASEDMVTPKSIKNVGTLGTSSQKHKDSARVGKLRKTSSSSSENFYNKESSDEMPDGILDDDDDQTDKVYKLDDRDLDSNFSDIDDEIVTRASVKKRPGRPKKINTQKVNATVANTSTPSHAMQQIRKSLNSTARKRKLDTDNDIVEITRKRFLLSHTSMKSANQTDVSNKKMVENQRTPTTSNQTLNGNKLSSNMLQTMRAKLSMSERVNLPTSRSTEKAQNPILHKAGVNLRKATSTGSTTTVLAKQRNSTPTMSSNVEKKGTDIKGGQNKSSEGQPSAKDDLEVMPTFTIVNINDIINKKGDVLISKTGLKGSVSKLQKPDNSATKSSTITKGTPTSSGAGTNATTDVRMGRRKASHTTILSEKIDPERLKSPLSRTPFPPRKPTHTILNHSLGNKTKSLSAVPDKPAPRILNSMVAKKTQPVKPMIANPDDSADESFPLSLDDEDDDDDDEFDDGNESESPPTTNKRRTAIGGRSLTPANYKPIKRITTPATKENSLAATNRIPTKTAMPPVRKISPEKVVISRQGDKIIKKITCFETWYVINAPEERPAKIARNILEMPLIKLANAAKDIKRPSERWSSKVTLYELTSAMRAKSTFTTYTGDLEEHNIDEEDRAKYQPSCVMFRRAVGDRQKSRLPYDRAVIFKNKTFFTNIDGKNVKLIGAPTEIATHSEVEILLHIVDTLTLQSAFVELATTIQ